MGHPRKRLAAVGTHGSAEDFLFGGEPILEVIAVGEATIFPELISAESDALVERDGAEFFVGRGLAGVLSGRGLWHRMVLLWGVYRSWEDGCCTGMKQILL